MYATERLDIKERILMTNEQQTINEVIENYLDSFLFEVRDQIAAKFGPGVVGDVEKIYNDAMNCHVDWRTATLDHALPALDHLIDDMYPWLSAKAKSNLRYVFIKTWK